MKRQRSNVLSRRRRIVFHVVHAFLLLAVFLVGSECVLRAIHRPHKDFIHTSSEFQYDPILGLKGIRGFSGTVGFNHVNVSINNHGFRDDDWHSKLERAQQRGASKILCLGDSTLYGYRIEKRDRLTEQLTTLAERNGHPVEVFNAAMPSFGSGQEFRCLELLFPEIQPDTVLLRYCSNDIGDSTLPYDYRYPLRVYKPFYDLSGSLILNERVPRRFSLWAETTCLRRFEWIYVVDDIQSWFLDQTFDKNICLDRKSDGTPLRDLTRQQKKRLVANMGHLATRSDLIDLFEANKERNYNLWQKMYAYCKSRGAKFLLLVDIPHATTQACYQEADILHALTEGGIPHVNMSAFLKPYRNWSCVRGDGHPNYLDNGIAAWVVGQAIVNPNLGPEESMASWLFSLPQELVFRDPASLRYIFGDWGRLDHGTREIGHPGYCLLRGSSERITKLTIEGTVLEPGETAATILHLSVRGTPLCDTTLPASGPFSFTVDVKPSEDSLVLLGMEPEGRIRLAAVRSLSDRPIETTSIQTASRSTMHSITPDYPPDNVRKE